MKRKIGFSCPQVCRQTTDLTGEGEGGWGGTSYFRTVTKSVTGQKAKRSNFFAMGSASRARKALLLTINFFTSLAFALKILPIDPTPPPPKKKTNKQTNRKKEQQTKQTKQTKNLYPHA